MIEVEIIGEEKRCDDCISRQAAIDALIALTVYSKKREIVKEADNHPNTWIEGVAECIDEIEDLPSAQPEIIRCKDCSKCQIDDVYHDYWCDGKKVWENHFCGYAEMRASDLERICVRRTDEETELP